MGVGSVCVPVMIRSQSPLVSTISRRRSIARRFPASATPMTPLFARAAAALVSVVSACLGKPAPSRNTRSTTSFAPPRPKLRAAPPPCCKSLMRLSSIHLRDRCGRSSDLASCEERNRPAIHSATTITPRMSPSPVPLPVPPSFFVLTPHVASHRRRTPSESHWMPSFVKMSCIRETTMLSAGLRI